MSLLVCYERGGRVNSAWEGEKVRTALKFSLWKLVVRGNITWYLVILVLFMEFGGAKMWGDALKTLFGVAMEATNEGGGSYGELGFLPRNNVVLKLYCKS